MGKIILIQINKKYENALWIGNIFGGCLPPVVQTDQTAPLQ